MLSLFSHFAIFPYIFFRPLVFVFFVSSYELHRYYFSLSACVYACSRVLSVCMRLFCRLLLTQCLCSTIKFVIYFTLSTFLFVFFLHHNAGCNSTLIHLNVIDIDSFPWSRDTLEWNASLRTSADPNTTIYINHIHSYNRFFRCAKANTVIKPTNHRNIQNPI